MSLNADYRGIEDYKNLVYVAAGKGPKGEQLYTESPLAQALVFMQMELRLKGCITEANHREVFKRIWILEKVGGPWLRDGDGNPRPVTLADVRRFIGLKTNAFGMNGTFKALMMERLFEAAEAEYERQAEELAKNLGVMKEAVGG